MMVDIIAPIQIDELYLVNSEFRIASSPAPNMVLQLNEEHQYDNYQTNETEMTYELSMTMSVNADLVNEEERDDVRVHAFCQVFIEVSVPKNIDESDADPLEYLKANALSMAYSHARSCIMMNAGLSPISTFVLPAILPYSILKNDDDQNQDNNSI